jgi:hypothetical protein
MRYRYQQLLYWTTVGYDVLLDGFSKSYYVTGYAKSGTNWLCRLMSDYTGFPVFEAWKHVTPPLGPQIFHVMRLLPFETVRKRSVYVMRDGRDAIVSRYYETIHREPRHKRDAERFLGHEMTDDNVREHLPRFIEFMSTYQGGCADYKSHLTYWLQHQYVTVRYEDLLRDTAGEMRRLLRELTGREPDADQVEDAVKKNSFEAVTQRARGEESKSAFVRKGISGDWKNYFTPESARAFDRYAGELLIRLGYERDRSWVAQVRDPA